MKTILVLTPNPEFAETFRSGLNPEQYRVVHRVTIEEAEPLLAHGLVHATIVDLEMTGVQGVWVLEKIRRCDAACPIVVFADAKQPEWEEQAYLQGVTHVLTKPVRLRMITALLDRLFAAPAPRALPAATPFTPQISTDTTRFLVAPPAGGFQTADVLRDFSSILTHSLDSSALLKQFLLLLRRIVSLNRAAIFLRQPNAEFGGIASPNESRRLNVACSIGVPANLLEHFELSLDSGLGGQLLRLGRILRRNGDEARNDVEIQKEFELLGGQVAVPMFDRETLIGVAVLDGRVTGEPLVNAELELIFHLLEQVSLAIRNIWLHDQLAANNEMMTGVLRELGSACVVVSRDLKILHANKSARKFFGKAGRDAGEMEFADLPQALGSKIYHVLRSGSGVSPFKFESENAKSAVYNISIVPFQRQPGTLAASALLIADDLTQTEQLRRLEVEASNLRLVKTMADRLAHEVGNAMVPLSTHQQLLSEKYRDAEFRASLDGALADGVKRVTRLVNQMRFLARDALASQEAFPVAPLIEEAFQEARKHQPAKSAQLKCDTGGKPVLITGDRAALKYALTEVMINALQANPADPKIGVRLNSAGRGEEHPGLQIEVQDNGEGFSPEAMQRASAPFFTTRNVGLGLGLAVSRKIIETHHGKLEIVAPKTGHAGIIRISLPGEAEAPQR
ncbi:MAG: hybrid sensor histidine kinase/response regulator [Pedosphaera sp.]|nr:hybrid sensor histidine kinase/response regulator [Pedosphaera sp.]